MPSVPSNSTHAVRLCGLIGLLVLNALLVACGADGARERVGRLSAPQLHDPDATQRQSSDANGIHLSWTRVDDPAVAGYYLYRDSQSIPAPAPDSTLNPALRANGGNMIPQPAAGPDVPYDDVFPVQDGVTYYYRVTTVDLNGDESYPSNEISFNTLGLLTIELNGVNAGQVFRTSPPPLVGVTATANADKVELLLDGTPVAESITAPFDGLELPISTLHNGQYALQARATRGPETALSSSVSVQVISLEGDVNGDGVVDMNDRDALLPLIGLQSTDGGYRAWYDTDNDGAITEADLSRVGYNFGLSL